jgi:hypothetical protein
MRQVLFLFFLLTLQYCEGQNVIMLRTGEKMNGKVDRLRNDSLTFIFKGNKMVIKTNEISAIYFDDKMMQAEESNTKKDIEQFQDGKISGVVTYFFNKNYGDKPDIGAEVYIVDSMALPDFNIKTIDSFHYGTFYRNVADAYKAMRVKAPADIGENIIKWGVDSKESYDALDKRATMNLFHIKYSNNVIKTVVDGSGTYSVSLKPGAYYIYIKSNNRSDINMTEVSGKIYCVLVHVKEGQTANVSTNFGLR